MSIQEQRGFHTHDGWFWQRLDDGSVKVTVYDKNARDGRILREQTLPANEWASVVASVSARRETAATFGEALAFHDRLDAGEQK